MPWKYIEEIGEIQKLIGPTHAIIKHDFREANQLADEMANEPYMQQKRRKWLNIEQLSVECRRILNIDKANIPTLRIKTRRIEV